MTPAPAADRAPAPAAPPGADASGGAAPGASALGAAALGTIGAPEPAVAHNVPAALSSFVGRAREVASVGDALATSRLVTLTGPGGAGKTRLAREVAARAAAAGVPNAAGAPAYPDGVWWVELAPVESGDGVAHAAAAVLGVRPESGRPPADVLAEAVGARHMLVVLDNCEHVVDAAAALAVRLLRACPRLTVLATSREALAVEGEAAWVVPPLAHPPRPRADAGPGGAGLGAGPAGGAAALAHYDAVQLFVERARAASPAFALTDRNAAAVAAVCARLDGIPLALELAAAHVSTLGVDALAARLDDVFALPARGRRAAPTRHQTLRAVLDWSYQLLAPAEQRLLCRLSVFRDAAALDAVAAVCGETPAGRGPRGEEGAADGGDVLAALGRLVEQSLVDVRDAGGGAVRYALLETVRQYGAARLAGTADEAALRDRHLAWAADFVARAEPGLWSARWVDEAARVATVLDDVRAAVQWAAAAADASPAGTARATAALRIVGGLMWCWYLVGSFDEATRLTEAALGAAVDAGVAAGARPVWTPASGAPPAARRAVCTAATSAMCLNFFTNRLADVMPSARNALALWEAECAAADAAGAPDPEARRWRAYTRIPLAEGHLIDGDVAGALAVGERGAAEARALGGRSLAMALMRRGFVLGAAGDHGPARAALEEAVALFEAEGDFATLANTLQTLVEQAVAAGDLGAAAAHLRRAFAAHRVGATPWIFVRTLDLAARLVVAGGAGGAPAAAARLLGAAARVRTRAGMEVIYYDRPAHDRTVAQARAALGEDAFRAAWREGEQLDPDAAAEYALSLPWPDAPVPAAHGAANGAANGAAPNAAPDLTPGAAPALRIVTLGTFAVWRDGRPLAGDEAPAGKVRELLLWLLLHPQGTKEQIGLALWPDASAAQLRSSFHFTLHHVRRALGDRAWIAHRQGHYALGRAAAAADGAPAARLECDVDALVETAERLRRAARAREAARDEAALDDAALARAHRVLLASDGELAAGLAAGDWIVPHQARVRAAWDDGMAVVAHALAARGRSAEAAAAYSAILARDPLREAAHRALMACHAAAGEPARALAHYDALVALLAREAGARPARETQALAERIRGAAA